LLNQGEKFLNQICGHEAQREELRSALHHSALAHALLFSGPQGVGKRTTALAFAAYLLAEKAPDRAKSLALSRAGNHPDFHLLTLAEERKDIAVEQIRELCSQIRLKPYCSSLAVSVINNAHLMSIAASNALLMTLEEPPHQSFIILVSHQAHRLPPTIVSRCQVVNFSPLSQNDLKAVFDRLCLELNLEHSAANRLLEMCDGTFEPLQLAPFIDEKTSAVTNAKHLASHLMEIAAQSEALRKRILAVCGNDTSLAAALSTASQLAAKDQLDETMWHVLRTTLRTKLLHSAPEAAAANAEKLLAALEVERLVKERNLNAAIQLSNLFAGFSSAR
jgi:DNA polymerase III delta prime subunit